MDFLFFFSKEKINLAFYERNITKIQSNFKSLNPLMAFWALSKLPNVSPKI